jgi:CBS domain-containing protein
MPPTLTASTPARHDHLTPAHRLDTEVRDAMTPGVITISEEASLHQVYRALVAHRVHSVLVVGHTTGRPLGWVTARGLLSWTTRDTSLAHARDAITHQPATIQPSATVREALTALSQPGISQLLVAQRPDIAPEGVLSDLDVVAIAAA